MYAFLVAFGLFATLIALGVCVSLYLYNQGAIGRVSRRRRIRGLQGQILVTEPAITSDESVDEEYMDVKPADDSTARFARVGLLLFVGSLLIIALFVATAISALMH